MSPKYLLPLILALSAPALGHITTLHGRSDSPYVTISAQDTHQLLIKGRAILVDVREWEEVVKGMAKPARWMPLSRIRPGDHMWDDFLSTLPKDRLIVFYCVAGKRACLGEAAVQLEGYRAANMGGYSDWVKAGLPIRYPDRTSSP